METQERKSYPTDVADDEWALVAPYLTLMTLDAPQRRHDPREIFNALRWIVRTRGQWRMLPNDFPRWEAAGALWAQQTRRWMAAEVFETMAHDPRALPREAADRMPAPTATVIDSRTMQSSPESGGRGGYDGAKRRKGSKVHLAVDTLGHLVAVRVTPADTQDRAVG